MNSIQSGEARNLREGFGMRRILEAVSLAALAVLAWVTWSALAGPARLPSRIPTHFNLAGKPDGWGTPEMLLGLPVVAAVLYVLITWVSRHPSAFNFPVRVTPANRPRLERVALNMTAWLKAEMLCLLASIQTAIVESARRGRGELPAALMPAALVVVFGTIGWHIVAMRRAARPRATA